MTKGNFQREAVMFKALSNPKRLEIVHVLSHRELSATDIQRMTGFPQANLSQHLRALKDGQVIVAQRHGKNITYRLTNPKFITLTGVLGAMNAPRPARRKESTASEVQDPVCSMWVEPVSARWRTLYKGATYYFCASGCQVRFQKTPERYV